MNEQRINTLNCILNNSLRCVCKKNDGIREYKEFDILLLYITTAAVWVQSLIK